MSGERAVGPATGDEVELEIEKLVAGGDGFVRVEGLPVFVARSAPGDRLRIRVLQRKPDYARGEVIAVLRPSPERREAPCPYFERCGGCDLQHLQDDAQVRHKVAATRETLERLGGLAWPETVNVIAGPMWGYRLRARLHLEAAAAGGPPHIGYMAMGSHQSAKRFSQFFSLIASTNDLRSRTFDKSLGFSRAMNADRTRLALDVDIRQPLEFYVRPNQLKCDFVTVDVT